MTQNIGLINRARNLLWYLPFHEVCKILVEDGASREEAYCSAVAGKLLLGAE